MTTIEVTSDARTRVGEAVDDIRGRLDEVSAEADPRGAALVSSGSHPFARWHDQSINEKTRYRRLVERTQWWGRNMMIWGIHVHVGVEDRRPLDGTTPATRSPLDTALYAALAEAVGAAHPGAEAVPVIAPGGADSRFFRRLGIPAYGFGMFSPRWDHAAFRHLVHSDDERIDVASVHLAAHAIERVVDRVLG